MADGRSGAVVVIQPFGGALNLNIHLHALVLDGVVSRTGEHLDFHLAGRLTRDEAAASSALSKRERDYHHSLTAHPDSFGVTLRQRSHRSSSWSRC